MEFDGLSGVTGWGGEREDAKANVEKGFKNGCYFNLKCLFRFNVSVRLFKCPVFSSYVKVDKGPTKWSVGRIWSTCNV